MIAAPTTKIVVMGAGAVGCYYGGMLARAGHDVTLIGRPHHVDAIRNHGLLLETVSFKEYVAVDATTDAAGVRGAGLVLCCVKSTDTETAGQAMRPHLDTDALVLSLQNGVDNAERLQAVLDKNVVAPVVVYVAAEMADAGHVRHHGRGELVIPPMAAGAALTALFVAAQVPVQVSENVTGALWAKLVINCAYNALSAITQLPYGRLVQGVGIENVLRDVVNETLAVAHASGVVVPDDIWDAVLRIAETMPTQISSTAHDVARHKHSEIDHLNGYVMRRGEALGIATPVNRVLHALVKLLEDDPARIPGC